MADGPAQDSKQLSQVYGHLILWGTLTTFVAIGMTHGYYAMMKKAKRKNQNDDDEEAKTGAEDQDNAISIDDSLDAYLSGRGNITGWTSLGMSFFSTAMGQWILFFTPLIGYTQGWCGIFGQSVAWILALSFINYLAPLLQQDMLGHGEIFAITDWIRVRYSRAFQIYVAVVSGFSLTVFAGIELATMSTVVNIIVDGKGMATVATIATCIAVYLYCALNGFAGAVYTDTIQCVLVLLLAIPIVFTLLLFDNDISAHQTLENGAVLATSNSFVAALSTSISLFWSVMYDFSFWQRMFCADTKHRSLPKKATLFGFVLMFPVLTLLGVFGLSVRNSGTNDYFVLVNRIRQFGMGWIVVVLVLLITLVTSTLDSLLYAGLSILSKLIMDSVHKSPQKQSRRCTIFGQCRGKESETQHDVLSETQRISWLPRRAMARTHMCLFLSALGVGVMASIFQAYEATTSLSDLFYVANMLTATLVIPTFAGVVLPITNKGALCGALCGLLTPVVYGIIEFNGSFMAGLEMLTLMTFTTSSSRRAHESMFGVLNSSSPLLGGQQPLLNATLIRAINAGTLNETQLPVFYGDAQYMPFLDHFSSTIKPLLNERMIDVPFRPRTIKLFCLIPIVSLVVSFVVSKLDSIPSKRCPTDAQWQLPATCKAMSTNPGVQDSETIADSVAMLDATPKRSFSSG